MNAKLICGCIALAMAGLMMTQRNSEAGSPAGTPKAAPTSRPASVTVPAMWEYTAPLITPAKRTVEPSRAQKDPTVVYHGGMWHVFMTVKLPGRSGIEYRKFDTWANADKAEAVLLDLCESKYYCAPQVFYFAPHKKWYLVYQAGMEAPRPMMWVAYSTTTDISDPTSWTRTQPMLDAGPTDPRVEGGLDYWIICDEQKAYLFITNLKGKMYRLWTTLAEFPLGFRDCKIALQGEIFEASHTYRLKGTKQYLTIIEQSGQRYFKAYLADRLDGEWKPLADTAAKPFAGWNNVRPAKGVELWTDNISHGELIREGVDQNLVVDPNKLRLLFQGALQSQKDKGYGGIPWRLGLLTPVGGGAGKGR